MTSVYSSTKGGWRARVGFGGDGDLTSLRLVDVLELVEDGTGELEGRGLAAHVAREGLAAAGVSGAQ